MKTSLPACPYSMEKTVVLLTDDGDLSTAPSVTGFPSELYVYIGEKAKAGHPIEQAGFTGGSLYGLQVILNGSAVTEESDLFGLGTVATGFIDKASFKLVNLGDVSNFTPRELQDVSIAAGITRFRRPEDSAWDRAKARSAETTHTSLRPPISIAIVVSGACVSTTSAKILKRAARSKSY
jgi:hypothetical protein